MRHPSDVRRVLAYTAPPRDSPATVAPLHPNASLCAAAAAGVDVSHACQYARQWWQYPASRPWPTPPSQPTSGPRSLCAWRRGTHVSLAGDSNVRATHDSHIVLLSSVHRLANVEGAASSVSRRRLSGVEVVPWLSTNTTYTHMNACYDKVHAAQWHIGALPCWRPEFRPRIGRGQEVECRGFSQFSHPASSCQPAGPTTNTASSRTEDRTHSCHCHAPRSLDSARWS